MLVCRVRCSDMPSLNARHSLTSLDKKIDHSDIDAMIYRQRFPPLDSRNQEKAGVCGCDIRARLS
eukprot:6187011-Pleurochrysis_carterae.AAC.2